MAGRSLLGAVVVCLLLAASASGKTIDVRPGKNAIQKAVNRAEPGDRLLVRQGTYHEDVQVNKRLRIVGRGRKLPVVDGGCDTDRPIDVLANGVKISHLRVKGARASVFGYTVNVIGVSSVRLHDLTLRESCGGAYYGVNVFQTGALEITGLTTSGGFVDAGIYVGGIGDVGNEDFRIAGNEAFGNNIGILIEDSIPAANILVRGNFAHDNDFPGAATPAGILVRRSDGGRYIANRANRNGEYGIHLLDDGGDTADDNVLRDNRAFGNGAQNFFDQGLGNCGSGNSFPIDPCS